MFGDIVRQHRRRLGLSQEELAARAGLSVRGLRKLEANEVTAPRPATVRLLADAFGLTADERDRFGESAGAGQGGHTAGPVPAQLPPGVRGFVGRAAELAQLDSMLAGSETGPPTVLIIAISGMAGVGKTALAVHWAHRIRHRYPDGQLYLDLRGFDPDGDGVDPGRAASDLLDTFGIPAARIPPNPDARTALYRSVLDSRRVLILLDNAGDAEQVRPLLPGSATALVLVTSRRLVTPLISAYGAHSLTLDPLRDSEATDLLAERLGGQRIAAEPDASARIIEHCGRLPLALAIAAARAAARPALPIAALADELAKASRALQALDAGAPTTSVRAAFSGSYQALGPRSARLFRLLGLHPGPDWTLDAAAGLAGIPVDLVRSLLGELTGAHLVTERVPGRYGFHDLLRAYARDLAHTTDPPYERQRATKRLLDHYLHTAYAADRRLHTQRDPVTLPLTEPVARAWPEPIVDSGQAQAWLIGTRQTLLACVPLAAASGLHACAWQLAWSLDTVLDRRGHWTDLATAWRAGSLAAARLGHPAAEAYAYRRLARAETMLGRHEDALAHLRHALDLSTRDGDELAQANIHRHLGYLYGAQDDPRTALRHAHSAVDLFRAASYPRGEAASLNAVGWYNIMLADPEAGLIWCARALALAREVGDRTIEAHTWDSIGYAHNRLGRYPEAVDGYRSAIVLYREVGDRKGEADTYARLAETHQVAGDRGAARTAWQSALDILVELDDRGTEEIRAKLRKLDV